MKSTDDSLAGLGHVFCREITFVGHITLMRPCLIRARLAVGPLGSLLAILFAWQIASAGGVSQSCCRHGCQPRTGSHSWALLLGRKS